MNFYWMHFQEEVLFWTSPEYGRDLEWARDMAMADCLHHQSRYARDREWERWASISFRVEREVYQEWARAAALADQPIEMWLVDMIERGRAVGRVFKV